MLRRHLAIRILTTAFVWAAICDPCFSKERHFEQLRVLLISRAATCTSCHTTPACEKLNGYGEKLAGLPKNLSMADRIARIESEKGGNNGTFSKDRDVDEDGVPNWVEILAHKNPADPKDKPDKRTAEKITAVVSCHICHRETGLPGEGLAANPHNELGELLAKTIRPGKGPPKAKDDERIRSAAERIPILERLSLVKTKKPKGSAATYWQKLRLLHAPADANDKATIEDVKAFKKDAATRKRERKKTPTTGLDCKAHPADGFLQDAADLD